eukprot:2253471-Rhodomonas_salina.1
MSGTDIAYAATTGGGGDGNAGYSAIVPRGVRLDPTRSAIALRACRAMSGTDLAYGAVGLCACYAVSGSDIAYGCTRLCQDLCPAPLVGSYPSAYA